MKPEYEPLARLNERRVLARIESFGGNTVADRMGVSESTVSRFKNGELVQWCGFLSALGLRVVDQAAKCYKPGGKIDAVFVLAQDSLAKMSVQDLVDEDPE